MTKQDAWHATPGDTQEFNLEEELKSCSEAVMDEAQGTGRSRTPGRRSKKEELKATL